MNDKMRILWQSNSPWCNTGYGQQTHQITQRIRDLGYPIAIFPFYGHSGQTLMWEGMQMFPCEPGQDWGQIRGKIYFDEWKADVLITLQDTWPLEGLSEEVKWVPWTPVDHDPIAPMVVSMMHHSAIVKPIAMTRWGQEQLNNAGVESYYIPHGVHTQCFEPDPELREKRRKLLGFEDMFVIGMVGTNTVERKNWSAALRGFEIFARGKDDVVFYMHTEMNSKFGVNLFMLREYLKIEEKTCFPDPNKMLMGIDNMEMRALYNTMDVFLLPTKGEGFGIPIVEAQACGVPIITTKCTSHAELVGAGWFITDLHPHWTPQGSFQFDCRAEEVAEKLEIAYKTWQTGGMADLREKARVKALEYSWDTLVPEYWAPTLEDIQERINRPKNLEGIQPWRQLLIPQTCNPRKVLDLGSGITKPYEPILKMLGEYVAVDNRGGDSIVQADAHNLPFEDEEFGFVWCSEVLEHVNDPKRVVDEAKRVGKHGIILFSTPTNPNFRLDPDHKVVELPYARLATGDGLIDW
jgi:glycosyltransferase involved in cell wall biosynthesis